MLIGGPADGLGVEVDAVGLPVLHAWQVPEYVQVLDESEGEVIGVDTVPAPSLPRIGLYRMRVRVRVVGDSRRREPERAASPADGRLVYRWQGWQGP